jgi:hypothetical protein
MIQAYFPMLLTKGMSQEEEGGTLLRTVTAPYRSHTDGEMNLIGILYGLGLLIVLLPLLPFFVIIWVLSRLADAFAPSVPTE